MEQVEMIDRLKTAKSRLHGWIEAAQQAVAPDRAPCVQIEGFTRFQGDL
jgi:hypothetical protein